MTVRRVLVNHSQQIVAGQFVAPAASFEHNIRQELPTVDVVIGSVLIPGDAAIDQGGCFETSHPTTHSDPVYTVDGIVHYAVAKVWHLPYTPLAL